MVITGDDMVTVDAVPLTPVAAGVMLVWPAPVPRMTIFAASCPNGMNAGLGEIEARPGILSRNVMKLPPTGAGSESKTCVVS